MNITLSEKEIRVIQTALLLLAKKNEESIIDTIGGGKDMIACIQLAKEIAEQSGIYTAALTQLLNDRW